MSDKLLKNGIIYAKQGIVTGDILIRDGIIVAIGEEIADCTIAAPMDGGANHTQTVQIIDLCGKRVVPGFIDMHTHGGANVDVNAADAEDFHALGRFFAQNGTTSWLCSILTDTKEQTLAGIRQACLAIEMDIDGAMLLGIHLEGPFLAAAYKGAMPESLLQTGNADLFYEYQQAAHGHIRYMTVSPEVEGNLEMIRTISQDVIVGIGHSGADYDTAMQAIAAGAQTATHTFNAMRLFHQHEPAIMGAVLEEDIYCEAICDGRHLHPGSVRLLLKCKGYDKVIAVTDSIQAAGLPDGLYKLGVNDVIVKDGDARLASMDVRAGSTLTMIGALQNLLAFTGKPLERVLPLMTENPAKLLGIDEHKGSIAVGKDADLVILDDDCHVAATYVMGKCVYRRETE